jgi:plasmid stabilization system protein ParE
VRSFSARPNVVFYTFDEAWGEVRILRVIDGRRDLRTVFFGEPAD